jgi:hypothetical protein
VLPNYRTANETAVYTPISAKQKFIIGAKDSFDYPLLLLAGTFAGLGQLTNENPSFGQGLAGYGRRLGTAYADQAIGNMMTEAIYSSLLHEDPRYFRRGHGSIGSRTWYALTRVMVTRTDSGGRRFNFSEWVGNATGVAISNSYYPDNRNAGAGVAKLCEQVGTDAISQVLKEFWPDIKGKLFHHKDTGSLKSREKFIPIAEFAGDSACPTLAHKGWLSSGAGVSACQPNFPQLLTVAAR